MTDDPEITDPRDPYRRPDIVTELDRWLVSRASLREATVSHALLQRARDEIVGLRATKVLPGWTDALRQTRASALEEAAHECDEEAKGSGGEVAFRDGCETCAAAIRLLKEKGHD